MARKNATKTGPTPEATIDESAVNADAQAVPVPGQSSPEEAAGGPATDSNGPALSDGHDQILEEAPGMGPDSAVLPPGDPGDLSAFGRSAGLPDDLGVGDDSALRDITNPGSVLGSTLLDDLTGGSGLPDPTDDVGGASDGWSVPVIDDPTGRASSGDDFDFGSDPMAATIPGSSASEYFDIHAARAAAAADAYAAGDESLGDTLMGEAANALAAAVEATVEEASDGPAPGTTQNPIVIESGDPIVPDDDDDDDEGERQGGGGDDGTSGTQTMPGPDDGTGGDPEAGDFIGGRGDVDPAPEAEDHGGGEMIGGRGDVDPAPETEDAGGAGGLDMEMLGVGAIDPLDGESTLLGDDSGDLAEMTAAADLGGEVEIEFDDSLADADIGEEA